jgi:hypothetical protein
VLSLLGAEVAVYTATLPSVEAASMKISVMATEPPITQ